MNETRDEVSEAIAGARRRFPDFKIADAYPVCWPVYRISLTLTVWEEQELPAVALYILQLSNLKVANLTELSRLLGLPENYIAESASELLRRQLVVQRPDLGLEMTQQGTQTLSKGGRSRHPQRRHIFVPYDSLTRTVLDTNPDELLYLDFVQKNGLFCIPNTGQKPRLSELRIEEIRDYVRYEDGRKPEEIIEVSEIRNQDSRLRYRDGLILVRMDVANSDRSAFAVYRGPEYLESQTAAVQRLVDSGYNLVPDEFEESSIEPWAYSAFISQSEAELIAAIKEGDQALSDAEQDIAEVQIRQRDTQDELERRELAALLAQRESEKQDLSDKVVQLEEELRRATNGAFRLVKAEEHRPLLLKAIDQATTELILVSAWIGPEALDEEVCRRLVSALGRGVTVRIAWGLGASRRRDAENRRNIERGNGVLASLRKQVPQNLRDQLVIKLIETHEKFIICDDKFCAWGSLNWLSYRGKGPRRETSSYSERTDEVAQWAANAASLFR